MKYWTLLSDYLNKGDNTSYSKDAVEKVFKEGRKFGLGALVISQRPSEISETILAQVGTFMALRLTNSGDQSIVKNSAPDNLNSPSRVRIKLNVPRPTSDDPKLVEKWLESHPENEENYKVVVTRIRQQKI